MSYKCLKCGFDNTPGAVTMSNKCLKCGFDNTPPGTGAPPPHTPNNQQPPPPTNPQHHPTNPQPPPAKPQPPGETYTVFETKCLEAHNMYRDRHGVPRLKLNKNLCKFSKEWASTLVRKGRMEHRTNSKYGENIFSAWSSDPSSQWTAKAPSTHGTVKSSYYTFGREPSNSQAGHFTQVVWKSSTELGVGFAKSTKGNIYVVCNYNPPGNYSGRYRDNVPPKK